MRRGRGREESQVSTVRLSEAGERMLDEALDDAKAGRVRRYDNVDDLIADLHNEAAGD